MDALRHQLLRESMTIERSCKNNYTREKVDARNLWR